MLSLKKMSGEDSEDKRDAVFVKVTDSLSEAQRLMLNAQQLMEAEAEKLAQERKEFEEIRKKLDHVHFGKTVKLNVGGKIFKTSLETLCKDPRSMLAAMFSGRFELKPDEDGAYFIDRDGKLFRFILDYLRKGKLDVSDGKLALIAKPLSSEASFFQLRSLEEFLSRNRVQSFGNSSIITDSRQEETLLAFLRDSACETVNWCLLYKATRDGWQAKEFHARCDGKSPTLVVVKGESNVLGGYATAPWQSNIKLVFKHSENSFLFFLENSAGKPSMKFIQTFVAGIRYSKVIGPSFGNAISMDFTTMYDDSIVLRFEDGQAYLSSSGQSVRNHVGQDSLRMDEMEVFCPK